MKFIEFIGWSALVVGVGYLLLLYIYYKEESYQEKRELIANSFRCQNLIDSYNRSLIMGRPIMTDVELNRKLNQIIKDPIEAQDALERMKRKKETDKEYKQRVRNRRKVGYKYEIEIFEIFDTNRELSEQKLLRETESKFSINEAQAKELLQLWIDNRLVEACPWNPKIFDVGDTLKSESLSIDKTDLTRSKWLKKHGKTLKPISKECKEYIESYGFPF